MGQPFRLLVTGSRTWHDITAIEQALAMILARHPEGVLLVAIEEDGEGQSTPAAQAMPRFAGPLAGH